MITNQHQYRITNAQRAKLREALDSFDLEEATTRIGSKVLARAERDALQSEVDALGKQLEEYERLRSGKVSTFEADSLDELPLLLVRARIARGYSQRELAEKLGLSEQQIQRYETEQYAGASLKRLSEIATALRLHITEVAELQDEAAP